MKLYRLQRSIDRHPFFYCLAQGGLTGLLLHRIALEPATWIVGLCLSGLLQPVKAEAADFDLVRTQMSLNTLWNPEQIAEQPPESSPTKTPGQVIKFRLNDLSGVSEWMRAEILGNQVKILHTVVAQSGLSKGVTSIINAPIAIGHTWYDHPTSRITFQPKGCDRSDCLLLGTDVITIPNGTDIYQGQFTVEYTESGWVRTISFKLPEPKTPST